MAVDHALSMLFGGAFWFCLKKGSRPWCAYVCSVAWLVLCTTSSFASIRNPLVGGLDWWCGDLTSSLLQRINGKKTTLQTATPKRNFGWEPGNKSPEHLNRLREAEVKG